MKYLLSLLLLIPQTASPQLYTWCCYTHVPKAPVIVPQPMCPVTALLGMITGQVATYTVQAYNNQTHMNAGSPLIVPVTGQGICLSFLFVITGSMTVEPIFAQPTSTQIGTQLQWSVMVSDRSPVMIGVPGVPGLQMVGAYQTASPQQRGVTYLAAPHCNCSLNDCQNISLNGQCSSICSGHGLPGGLFADGVVP